MARSTVVISALLAAQAALPGAGAHARELPLTAAAPAAAPLPPKGIYLLGNYNSSLCLSVPDRLAEGAKTAQTPCSAPAPDPRWTLTPVAPAGNYTITNVVSKKCLAVPAPPAGAPAIQQTCGNYASQVWTLLPEGPGGRLRNLASKLNLSVAGASRAPGAPVIQTPPSSDPSQVWTFRPAA
ncbi:RICIN domain-containing protein [Actinomadura xylanilytica]|uniref:RICIN domain-containing protein n=1 Tax=Actinomadura xylanilytica TaxID=887459 RepID=UPI00255AD24B|nr:RICIN domain-containing protein [Actinomadura xylanilytica]MDL4770795.1 RICIN domain-containing protein [Actinomadura xylanilytica]